MEKSIVMDFYGLRSVEALSPTELQVVFGASLGGNYRNPASYYIVSFDDQVYNYTKMVMPLKVAELKESLELKTSYAGNFQKTTLRLTLPFPMKAGNQYAVATSGITFGRTGASLIYRPNARGTDGKTENPMDTLGFRGFENLGESCLRLMFGPAFNPQEGVKIKNYTIKLNGTSVPFEMISTRAVIDGHRAQGNPLETILRHDVFVRLVNAKVSRSKRQEVSQTIVKMPH